MRLIGIFLMILGIVILVLPFFLAEYTISAATSSQASRVIGIVILVVGATSVVNRQQSAYVQKRLVERSIYEHELELLRPFEAELFQTVLDFGTLEDVDPELQMIARKAEVRLSTVRRLAGRVLDITQ